MRLGVLRPASLLSIGLTALAVMVAVSCQPRPDARDRSDAARSPTMPTVDHHPPPRNPEP